MDSQSPVFVLGDRRTSPFSHSIAEDLPSSKRTSRTSKPEPPLVDEGDTLGNYQILPARNMRTKSTNANEVSEIVVWTQICHHSNEQRLPYGFVGTLLRSDIAFALAYIYVVHSRATARAPPDFRCSAIVLHGQQTC